jgi:hypothetical protein
LKPARVNSLRDPISKNPIKKIGLVEWFKVEALNSSLSSAKKKKEERGLWKLFVLLYYTQFTDQETD